MGEKEPQRIIINTDGKPVDIEVNGVTIHVEPQPAAPKPEEDTKTLPGDEIVDWFTAPDGRDYPITQREKDHEEWLLKCRTDR